MQILLQKFGLDNFDIYGNWKRQCIKWKQNLITYDHSSQCYTYIDKYITHNYHFVSILKQGGYNDIKLCRYNSKAVIIRSTKEGACRLSSFIENVKTIFLYCWYTYNFPDNKIFPDIYTFSYNIITDKYYLVMEYIPETLYNYIIDNKTKKTEIITKIIKTLHQLSIIKFRHGDFTYSNILVQNNQPIYIDFGFSSFIINDKWFDCETNVINYSQRYIESNIKGYIYNQLHDLILLFHSLSFANIWIPNIVLPDMILSGRIFHYFIRIFSNKLTAMNKDLLYEDKLAINYSLYFDEPGCLDLYKHAKIFAIISPKLYHSLFVVDII